METRPSRLGVLGGTFDPPHAGHLLAARASLRAFELERVLFVPAGRPWQKSHFAPAEDRHLMTVLTAASDERFAVSRIELDRAGPTYTSDTLEQLKEFFGPSTQAFFIVGSDVVASLGTWRNLKRLRDLVEFIAVTRPGRDAEVEIDASWPTVHRLDVKGLEVSSTEVRERVRQKRSIDGLVAPDVAAYIGRRRLYRGEEEAGGA